jgi:hypothetical protein
VVHKTEELNQPSENVMNHNKISFSGGDTRLINDDEVHSKDDLAWGMFSQNKGLGFD